MVGLTVAFTVVAFRTRAVPCAIIVLEAPLHCNVPVTIPFTESNAGKTADKSLLLNAALKKCPSDPTKSGVTGPMCTLFNVLPARSPVVAVSVTVTKPGERRSMMSGKNRACTVGNDCAAAKGVASTIASNANAARARAEYQPYDLFINNLLLWQACD